MSNARESLPPWILRDGDDALVRVKAVPGSSRDRIAGILGDRLKVCVAAPPEGGRANRAVAALVAGTAGVRAGQAEVESGHGRPEKVVRIRGVDAVAAAARIGAAFERNES